MSTRSKSWVRERILAPAHKLESLSHSKSVVLISLVLAWCANTSSVMGADKLVTANANLSTLVTADDTVLRWTGSFTVTVDSAVDKTVAGIDAGSFTATIDFQNANRKVLLGNTSGNVVFEADGGGEIRILGAGTGARTAGFLVSPSLSDQTIEVRSAIDDAVNANYWIIGNHTLLLAGSSPQVGSLDIGSDGGVAKIDVDQGATIDLVTLTGDLTMDVAAGKTLAITQALTVGANTLTVTGAGSTSSVTNGAQITLDSANSVLQASGTVTVDDVDLGASAKISLLDGATLTLTDAIAIGARTLTLSGTTGGSAETITATGGFLLDDANSVLKIEGDSSNAMVISKVDTSTDLNAGKGVDVDQSANITDLNVSHNATLDVASGKTLGGTVTLDAAKTLVLNNTGTVSAITTSTAAGTIQLTAAGTITTLTNGVSGTTIDVDESVTINTLTVTQNADANVATGKTLTTAATVAASRILTASGAGTISKVVLNGTSAELNVTGGGTISTLDVTSNGGILDVDTSNCTVNVCNMSSGAGDLTVENASRTISSSSGFDVNNNTLTITQASGTMAQVKMDTTGGILDINETTTFTALDISADVTAQVATGKSLTTTATVTSSGKLKSTETGTITSVTLNGMGSELNMTAGGVVTTVTVASNGAVIDVDSSCTLSTISMTQGSGDLTLKVQNGKTLTSNTDVNDNTLTLTETGAPGIITMDTDGGVLNTDADSSPGSVIVTADVTIDVAANTTLGTAVDIGTRTLTLAGSGTLNRIDASTGTVKANGSTTITDLRPTYGSGGIFTYDGVGTSTVTTLANAIGSGETFRKTGSGTLTVTNGFAGVFATATGVRLAIDEGALLNGASGGNHDITLNDDGDEIVVASGASLTIFGGVTVSVAGANVNVDAAPGSVVNLLSTSPDETLVAASDNDFQFLGTLNISGPGGGYTLKGPHIFQFGDITIGGTSSLINTAPSSTMQFRDGARIDLLGGGADGGELLIDGQATATRIVVTTINGQGSFTIDRNGSDNLTINNVALSNATYLSNTSAAAIDELKLTGTADVGDNTNIFTPAVVEDDDDEEVEEDQTEEPDAEVDDAAAEVTTYDGDIVSISNDGSADAAAVSPDTGASGFVAIADAVSGSVFVTIADGNLRSDFAGIEGERALAVTMRVTSSVAGDFAATVQLCYTDELLADAAIDESELVLYVYDQDDGLWALAGAPGRYRGDREPTSRIGDYGLDSATMCVWAVRDGFSDFAAGVGPTDSSGVTDDSGEDDATGTGPTRPPLCGLFGMMFIGLMLTAVVGLKYGSGRRT
ncbi:MAG: hypothetical protein V3W34_03845 [Phycisphaerae bacterium]